jgi:ssRNA-specific RNase YbeY (16S rRNA maturation enzyme)
MQSIIDFFYEFGLLIIFITVLFIVFSRPRQITWYAENSTIDPNFVSTVRKILSNSLIHENYNIKEASSQEEADVMIYLKSKEFMDKHNDFDEYYPNTNKIIRFSLTYQSPLSKPYIYIDETNWMQGVSESNLSLNEYRQYVIQHEFMHALGYDHIECNEKTAVNGVCPVLYQSTRGCPKGFKCGYSVTKNDYLNKIPERYFR